MAQQNSKSVSLEELERDVFGAEQREIGTAGVAADKQMILPGAQGDTAVNIFNGVITAQRVAVKRDEGLIYQRIKAAAAAAGRRWVYSWEVNDKNSKTGKSTVEGATIKCTNAVARIWGNCMVDTRITEEAGDFIFYSKFVDFETGFALVRSFQQRKSQSIGGKYDAGRALDMVFQIGQSKSQRNVVKNALEDIVDYAVQCAKSSVLDRITKEPEKARAWCVAHLAEMGIDIKRVERARGRKAENWTPGDMAKVYAEIQSIDDGMAAADEVWPEQQTNKTETTTDDVFADKNPDAKNGTDPATPKPATNTATADTQNHGSGSETDGHGGHHDQQAQGRALVMEGGVFLARTLQEYELGEQMTHGGKQYRVTEFTDKQVVVVPVKAAPAKSAAKQTAAPAAKNKLFGDD